ncbi:Protein of unknown function [Gryllus bimaculatus]|nr:Protein of unknown function [Gryllus bimaculatus]
MGRRRSARCAALRQVTARRGAAATCRRVGVAEASPAATGHGMVNVFSKSKAKRMSAVLCCRNCPPSLLAPITRIVIDEIKQVVETQPQALGFKSQENYGAATAEIQFFTDNIKISVVAILLELYHSFSEDVDGYREDQDP